MPVVLVTRDLMSDPPAWEVVRANPDAAPEIEVICPALRHELDGSDMIALVMPPPAEVSFSVDAKGAPATLRMRAGVDITASRLFGEQVPEGIFAFEVLLNGELVHANRVTVRRAGKDSGSEWSDVGGAEGLEVEPGDVVTLRTLALAPDGTPARGTPVAYAGFGGMRLERRLELPRTRSSPSAPNVVLVVMDTLRADRLSTYGHGRATSPALDALAERGVVFENACATASWTWPSTASIFTGLQPEEHGVQDSSSSFLATELDTIAEAMQRGGVTTAGWSGNPLITRSRNFAQGFERFDDDMEDFRKTGEFFDRVLAWLDETAGTRFFLYLHLTEPHRPYAPLPEGRALFAADAPATIVDDATSIAQRLDKGRSWTEDGRSLLDELTTEEERRHVLDIYDACVWSGDHWLGELLSALDRLELAAETLVVFTSDHGEELFERNYLGHSKTVHAELVRVPLVLAGPGVPAGRRVAAPTSNSDLARFLTALAGAPVDRAFDPQGFFGEGGDRRVLYSTEKGSWNGHQNTTIRGIRAGDLALQYAPRGGPWGSTSPEGDVRLYDLAQDPAERDDLAARRPDELAQLRAMLEREFEALEPRVERARYTTGAATEHLLERIGYAGD